jgi:AAA domain/Bifunctional DNA primase/polymerase, N-terminal/Primase C terminal 1 (PriCT-1)
MTQANTRAPALAIARKGPNVFRLARGTKNRFIDTRWAQDATTAGDLGATSDLAEVFDKFAGGDFNIGVRTDGLIVIDVDAHKGGLDSLPALGPLSPTYTVRTPNGGLHIYYRAPEGVQFSGTVEKLARGIDTRSARNYVVGAGSEVGGKPYTVESDAEIVPAPDHLIRRLTLAPKKAADAAKIIGELDTPMAVDRATAWLNGPACPRGQLGSRNNDCFKAAAHIFDFGLTPETALDLMEQHWNSRCEPPLDETELETTVSSAGVNRQAAVGRDNPSVGFEPIEHVRPAASYELTRVSNVKAEPIEWLWPDRIALGMISIIAGPAKRGKSQLTCALAAAVTTGGLWPDGTRAPKGSVVFIGCEDDIARTVRPRLEAADADVSKVHYFEWAVLPGDGSTKRLHFDVQRHAPNLEQAIRDLGDVRLIVIDPISAYMGKADSHKTADVRAALLPIQMLTAKNNVASIMIAHLNKSKSMQSAADRVSGSGAFVAVSRGGFLIDFDPKDETVNRRERRRVMAPIGANVGNDGEGFYFHIRGVTTNDGIQTSKLVFDGGAVDMDADEVVSGSPRELPPAIKEAMDFLNSRMADGCEHASKALIQEASERGISKSSLHRACERLKVIKRKDTVARGDWLWKLSQPISRGFEPIKF